jgi:threonine synthase
MNERREPYLGEGQTPVLSLTSLAKHFGLPQISAKAEYLNPTGSYKDRIAAATVKDAIRQANRGWIGTSSGNGGAAMSAYGSRAGLPGFLCIPTNTPPEKLKSIVPYGTTLFLVPEIGMREMDAIKNLSDEFNLKMSVTAYQYNPEGMAGAELIGSELRAQGSFSHVYVPTGGGGLLVAVARGLNEISQRSPKIICAQPSGCGPISRYLLEEIDAPTIPACDSKISGLLLPDPPDGRLATDAVRRTEGWGCLVEDDKAYLMQDLLAQKEGIFVEPASALALAAMIEDFRQGHISDSDNPLVILTGSGLKDLRRFEQADAGLTHAASLSDLQYMLKATFGHTSDF